MIRDIYVKNFKKLIFYAKKRISRVCNIMDPWNAYEKIYYIFIN